MFSKMQRGVYTCLIIIVGSFEGGLKALQHLIRNYTSHLLNTCIIVAQHRRGEHKSILAQLLANETWMKVMETKQRYKLDADFYFQKPAYLTQDFHVIESVAQTWASNKNNG